MELAQRTNLIEISGIRKAFTMAEKIKDPLDLSIGQPDFDVPEVVKKEAIKKIKDGFNHYTPTQGILPLRQKIAQKLGQENSIKVSPDQVIVTAGTTGAIYLVFLTLLNHGDEVIIFDPYFIVYKQLVTFIGAKVKMVSTFPDFQPDINKLKKAITPKTKMIVLNSPNNPTGAVYNEKLIRRIVKVAEEHRLFLLSDEVYEDFIYEEKHFSPGNIYPKTITLNGFSKSASMTGWRLGYAAGPQEIIEAMIKLQQCIFVCPPSFAQKAAIKALDWDNKNKIREYKRKRNLIYYGLKDYYQIVKPQGAFYAFVKAPTDEKKFFEKLLEHRVIVVPGSVFSEKKDYIRLSFSASLTTIKKAVEIFRALG